MVELNWMMALPLVVSAVVLAGWLVAWVMALLHRDGKPRGGQACDGGLAEAGGAVGNRRSGLGARVVRGRRAEDPGPQVPWSERELEREVDRGMAQIERLLRQRQV